MGLDKWDVWWCELKSAASGIGSLMCSCNQIIKSDHSVKLILPLFSRGQTILRYLRFRFWWWWKLKFYWMIPSPMRKSCHYFRGICFLPLNVSPNHSFRTTMKMAVESPSGKSVSTNRHGVVPKELGSFNRFQEWLHNRFLWEAIKCVWTSYPPEVKLPQSCFKDVNRSYQD
jgi:hypothetical protein